MTRGQYTTHSPLMHGLNLLLLYFSDGPVIDADRNSFTVEERMTISVPFSAIANPQPDSYVLQHQDVIVSNVYINSTVIVLANVTRNQTGQYSLMISNNISTTTYNFTIDVTCKL